MKNRASTVEGLLQNYQLIDEVIKSAENAEGSAAEENLRYLDSIEGRIAQFQNSVQEFWHNLISSETVKMVVGAATKIMSVLADIVAVLGEGGVFTVGLSTLLGAHGLLNKLSDEENDSLLADIYKLVVKGTFKENNDTDDKTNAKTFGKIFTTISKGANEAKVAIKGLGQDAKGFDKLKAGASAFNKTLGSSIGIVGKFAIAIGALSLIHSVFDYLANSTKRTQEAVDDLMSSFNAALSSANSNIKKFDELSSRYEVLSKGVNKLGQNVALTSEEYEEYNDITNQIAEMSPTLVAGYTTEGNAILTVAGNVDELRSKLESARDAAYEMLISSDAIFKNWANQSDTGFFAKILDGWNWANYLGGIGTVISYLEDIFNWDNIEVGKGVSTEDAIKELENFQKLTAEQYHELLDGVLFGADKIVTNTDGTTFEFTEYILDAMGLDRGFTEEEFAFAKKKAQILAAQLTAVYNEELQTTKQGLNGSLLLSDGYDVLSQNENLTTFASALVNSIDADFAHKFDDDPALANQWVESLVDALLQNQKTIELPLNSLLKIDVESLAKTMDPNEIKEYVDGFIQQIVTVLTSSGVEVDIDAIIDGLGLRSIYEDSDLYDRLTNEFHNRISADFFSKIETGTSEKLADAQYQELLSWFNSLNFEDKKIAYDIVVNEDGLLLLDVIINKFNEIKRAAEASNNEAALSGLSEWIGTEDNKDAISDVKSRIDTLRSAFDKLTELQNLIKDKTSDGAFDFSVEQSELDTLLFDLLQEFPQLAEVTDGSIDSIEELRLAIARLCGEQPQKMIDELKKLAETEGITQAAKDELLDFAQTLENISQFDLSEIFDIEMDTTKQVINDMQDGLYQIAELKAAINDEGGLRLDFDEAKEYLKVFPELLRGAKYCADGTVQLNEGVTNEFIASREAQIRADGQTRIAELENAKEVYVSKRDYSKAQLEAIKVGLEAESLADTQAVITKIQNIDAERKAFIQSGIDEVIANQAAAKAIGDDTKTLSDYIKEAVGISRDNVDIGAQDAANAVNLNAQAMQSSIYGVGKMANAANQAVAKIGTGELVRLPGIEGESGKSSKKTFKDLLIQQGINPATGKPIRDLGNINGLEGGTEELEGLLGKTQEEAIAEAKAKLEKMKSDLEKNIQGYDEAIASIDKQIEMINASASAKLDDYVAGIINSESDKKDKESSEKTFDWIETLIQNLERELQKLGNIADSTYIGWAERNSALAAQLEKTKELIGVQQAAYTRYMQEAESVGLSPYWKNLAKNGIIDISVIADEDLAEKISSYQEWIDKANGAQDAIQDLQNQLADISRSKFNNIAQEYDNKLSAIEHEVNVLNSLIEQTENRGHIVSEQYYKELINQEKKNKSLLEQEYSSLQAALAEAMRTGNIQESSEEWHSMQQELNGVQEAIIESNTAIIEFQNNIRQLKWDAFDRLQDKISNITSEAEFLISLMEDSDLFDDKGQLTNTGMATMGLHGQNYNVYMAQADKYAEEMANLDKEYSDDLYNTNYLERRQELLELQQDSILAAQDEKNAIRDLVEEGINLELEALQKLIDEYNKAQENARDLYEYQKNIQEQVENISSLEKQLSAYQGDTSEENKQRIQQIKVQLEEAREDLEETEMEHALSETQKMLDELYSNYEIILNERLDNIDTLLADMIDKINTNSSSISETIIAEADKVGYDISESLQNIWSNEGNATSVITKYGENFCSQLTSVNAALNAIREDIHNMTSESDEKSDSQVKEEINKPSVNDTPASAEPPKNETSQKPQNSSTGSAGPIKVGGRINAGSALIY